MVMHKNHPKREPHYMVMAKVMEPDYAAEARYLAAERAYVERELAKKRHWIQNAVAATGLGVLTRDDWKHYKHELDKYESKLADYAEEVRLGVLPVKFAVYNDHDRADRNIHTSISVTSGRVDAKRTPPSRPDRIDAIKRMKLKIKLPKPGEFSRSNIEISTHKLAAQFSLLGPHDGAVLINQLVHIHCGPETEVEYVVSSQNVHEELGDVSLSQSSPTS